jgi:hypothetical protein
MSKYRNRVLLAIYVTGILFSSEVCAQTDYLRSIGEGRFEQAHSVKFSSDGTMLANSGHNANRFKELCEMSFHFHEMSEKDYQISLEHDNTRTH